MVESVGGDGEPRPARLADGSRDHRRQLARRRLRSEPPKTRRPSSRHRRKRGRRTNSERRPRTPRVKESDQLKHQILAVWRLRRLGGYISDSGVSFASHAVASTTSVSELYIS